MTASRFLIALLFGALAAVPGASAATLVNVTGDVLVNNGRGFQSAVEGQAIGAGARVMVGRDGGSATISYDLTCSSSVVAGSVVTVQQGVPCNKPSAQTSLAPLGADVSPGILIGGTAAAVGVGAVIYFSTNKSSSP